MLINVKKEVFNLDDLMSTVNVPTNPLTDGGLLLEINETKDLAKTWFAGWAAYKKSMENGVLDLNDLMNLLALAITLPSLFSGSELIPAEVHDLNLEELATLVAEADNHDLGTYKKRAQDLLVMLLYGYKGFTNPPTTPEVPLP